MTRFILTAAEMRAAEERAIAGGASVETLMERAGAAVAEAAWRFAGPVSALILCGPGNNGGDGYVIARLLKERGVPVRVAALGEPKAGAAAKARAAWSGPVEPLGEAAPATLVVDALFGTGLSRGLAPEIVELLNRHVSVARVSIAVDLPSGVETDSGACLSEVPRFDMTVALGSLKPAHLLQPAAAQCGRLVVGDIGIDAVSRLTALARPDIPRPMPADHKYSRGQVAVVRGAMPGAPELAALAAAHAGAGYVLLLGPGKEDGEPHAIVRRAVSDLWKALDDQRIRAVVVGPGLGRDETARRALDAALGSGHKVLIDGDALHLLDLKRLAGIEAVLTPHEGEFRALFGELPGSKVDRAREASARAGAVVVYKGADTVIAAPNGEAVLAGEASVWLSTAGTGDVLAGAIGAMLARGLPPFAAAQAGVWLHAEAARRAGKGFVADQLAAHLSDGL